MFYGNLREPCNFVEFITFLCGDLVSLSSCWCNSFFPNQNMLECILHDESMNVDKILPPVPRSWCRGAGPWTPDHSCPLLLTGIRGWQMITTLNMMRQREYLASKTIANIMLVFHAKIPRYGESLTLPHYLIQNIFVANCLEKTVFLYADQLFLLQQSKVSKV